MLGTSLERVRTALCRTDRDRVPCCDLGFDWSLAQQLTGRGASAAQVSGREGQAYSVDEAKALAGDLLPENALALSGAVQRYGRYPMSVV